jgi:hypothetical protein
MRPLTRVLQAAARVLRLVHMALAEIFEESAYQRFLERQGIPSSREAYAGFLRESAGNRARRPSCC